MILFEVHAVTCVRIRTTNSYWRYVTEVKHPESFKNMSFETAVSQVKETLSEPEVVLRGEVNPSVFYLCGDQVLKWGHVDIDFFGGA